ncbi:MULTISPECIES: ribosomal protein S18-alanine N-acetyltransferase [unclassified Methanobrevibacter]|jgi:ribosomal-protein-alanine N-acetyltransferase|uniref:ribosomal protein S18-alanine N-acetyltransferase n=1 Tax=unclassified Methanobrevibacter TaxID=2638681 RepID=UPI0025FEF322|nr:MULTISPECIES: ribosomal protein S18-alanine N-acetyltransferase [unclassified Methanobrevibacter]MEE0942430.1 ribosomal protein S18-alanine N-acetyltransferase [Methanobrevibacter sp.]
MKVRKFVPKDLKRVFEIENMSFDQSYGINMFQQLYEMGIGFLVAEKDDYVVGYVMFWVKYENQGHIISIAVDKNYRRQGAGTELLIRAISILSMLPIDAIYLEVRESNAGAVEFYERFNFIKDRVVPGYYESGEGAIIMYLPMERGKVAYK